MIRVRLLASAAIAMTLMVVAQATAATFPLTKADVAQAKSFGERVGVSGVLNTMQFFRADQSTAPDATPVVSLETPMQFIAALYGIWHDKHDTSKTHASVIEAMLDPDTADFGLDSVYWFAAPTDAIKAATYSVTQNGSLVKPDGKCSVTQDARMLHGVHGEAYYVVCMFPALGIDFTAPMRFIISPLAHLDSHGNKTIGDVTFTVDPSGSP